MITQILRLFSQFMQVFDGGVCFHAVKHLPAVTVNSPKTFLEVAPPKLLVGPVVHSRHCCFHGSGCFRDGMLSQDYALVNLSLMLDEMLAGLAKCDALFAVGVCFFSLDSASTRTLASRISDSGRPASRNDSFSPW